MDNITRILAKDNLKRNGYNLIANLSNIEFHEICQFAINETKQCPELKSPKKDSVNFDTINLVLRNIERKLDMQVPVAQIVGSIKIGNLELQITPDVLIPRVETEGLIELGKSLIFGKMQSNNCKSLTILEVGIGSGYISFEIGKTFEAYKVVHLIAIEKSRQAARVARSNLRSNKIKNVDIVETSIEEFSTDTKFDLIISNPPYIPTRSKHVSRKVKLNEPTMALFAGQEGLDVAREILQFGKTHLNENSHILLELNSKSQILKLEKEYKQYFKFQSFKDTFGKWRYCLAN